MSLFGLLSSGATGLHAQGFGMQVTAQNAQNAGTDGYSRRDVRLGSLPGPPDGGGGVQSLGSRRIVDTLLERRLLGANSARAEATSRESALSVLDRVLADVEGGLGPSLDDFEVALSQLVARPSDPAVRTEVLATAQRMAASFNHAAADLRSATEDLDSRVAMEVEGLDGTLKAIADLGVQIQRAELDGREASDLRDRRAQLVGEVAEKLPITTVEGDDGSMSVLLGGSLALVTQDGRHAKLGTATDPTTGRLTITRMTAGRAQDVTRLVDGGALGGMIAARDGAIADATSALDQLAFDIATAYDAAHAAGFGQDGVGGRPMFEPLAGVDGAAAALRLSADLVGRPDRLAAASEAGLSGDNRGALALAGIADASVGGFGTAQQALGAMIGAGGQAVVSARRDATFRGDAAMQLEAVRGSVSGVSVDEEMIALSKYQRGYQAALKVVQTADEMLAELMQMKR